MKSTLSALAFALISITASATTVVECPQTLDVTTSVSAPASWEAIPPRLKPSLEGITVYDGHPNEMASLVPTELPKKGGFERAEWDVGPNSSEFWLECRYRGTYHTIAKRLPKGQSKCVAYFKTQKYGLGSFERIECR